MWQSVKMLKPSLAYRLSKVVGWHFFAILTLMVGLSAWEHPRALALDHTGHPETERLNVVAAVPRDWPPQYSTDKNGRPIGFAIDVMNAVADRAGLTVTYKTYENFPEALDALARSEVDLIPNTGILPQRTSYSAFTEPVETFLVSIFVREDTHDLEGEADLVGRRLAIIEKNISTVLFGKRTDIDLVIAPDVRTALFELLAGQVDAIVYPQPVLMQLAREIGVADRIKVVGNPLKEVKRGIQVQKEDVALLARLNAAVKSYVHTPEYEAVYAKWYGVQKPYWTTARVAGLGVGLIAITLLGAVGWHYLTIVRLNRALTESEERFHAFSNHTPNKQHIKDLQGRYTLLNRKSEILYGLTNEQACGKTAADIFPPEICTSFNAHDRAVIETGKPLEAEEQFELADGTHTYLTVKFPILGRNGEIVAVGASGHEITDRKRVENALKDSEDRYREIIEGTEDLITVVDPDGRIQFVNHMAERVFGLPQEDCVGLLAFDFVHPDDTAETRAAFRRWRAREQPSMTFENRQQSRDGSVRHMLWSISARFDENQNISSFLSFARDITDRKLAERALQSALVDAERANQAKSEFLATMSHEFRTPLNAILGFSEMLRAQYFGPLGADNYRVYAEDIHFSGQHMLALVNDMLDIAAIEAGKRPMTNEAIDIAEVLQESIRNIEPGARDKGIELNLTLPTSEMHIYADRRSIFQILLNLLSNAVKFTDENGLITASVAADGENVSINIRDTGIGIGKDKLPTITNPFTQTHSNPHITQTGTGLGLAIVKSLVEVHGGRLEIESEIGVGTMVSVTFALHSGSLLRAHV